MLVLVGYEDHHADPPESGSRDGSMVSRYVLNVSLVRGIPSRTGEWAESVCRGKGIKTYQAWSVTSLRVQVYDPHFLRLL